MKKIFLIILLCLVPFNVHSFDIDITAKEALLINLDNNKIYYEKNPSEKTYIASLTKIMTALVAVENIDNLKDKVSIEEDIINYYKNNQVMVSGYKSNTLYTYEDIIYGLLLASGADCSYILEKNVKMVDKTFIDLMNDKAKELKMENTSFSNAIGLDDVNNYSTANDLAILYKKALENEFLRKVLTTKEYTASDKTKIKSTVFNYIEKNNLGMDYILGGKTGTETLAKYCLITTSSIDDNNLLLIILNSNYDISTPYHFLDTKKIYELMKNNYQKRKVIAKNDQLLVLNTVYSKEDKIYIRASKNYYYYLDNNYDSSKITLKYDGLKDIYFNTKKGERFGEISIYYENELLDKIDVYLNEKIHFSIKKYLNKNKEITISLIIVLSFLFIFFLRKCIKKTSYTH